MRKFSDFEWELSRVDRFPIAGQGTKLGTRVLEGSFIVVLYQSQRTVKKHIQEKVVRAIAETFKDFLGMNEWYVHVIGCK